MPPTTLRLDGIRPLNHPVRRLAYLAHLVTDARVGNLQQQLIKIWSESWRDALKPEKQRSVLKKVLSAVPSYPSPYWSRFTTFGRPSAKQLTLLGNSVRQEILINTAFPILYDAIKKRGGENELEAFISLFKTVPAIKSGKAEYLAKRLFNPNSCSLDLSTSIRQQGALQLHRDFCTHYESSCVGCPFPDRFNPRL